MRHILTIIFLISLHASGQLRNPGQFVPLGGLTGQVLKKVSNTDWDIVWGTAAGGGDMLTTNNLSDLTNASTARTNLGVNTTANISNSTNKNFVTDAQSTVIGNTSGTNTGDQTAIVGITGTHAQFNTAVTDADLLATNGNGSALTGMTSSQVGLGNVTNESKATMFTNPAFTGIPIAPTASLNTNTTQVATTAYVDTKLFTARLASDHAISSTTATEVTLGATSITAGTYIFTYYLLVQSATTTVSPMYGINFTGTAAVRKMTLRYPSTGTSASTGVADDVVAAPLATGNVYESQPVTAFTTASPNMGHIAAVAAINVDIFVIIEGIMIVTATGDLELWHSSETATSTTIKAGSSLVLIKSN